VQTKELLSLKSPVIPLFLRYFCAAAVKKKHR